MRVLLALLMLLTGLPVPALSAQGSWAHRRAACRCEPDKKRRPRVLLPVAGGLAFLPMSLAARDSQPPTLGFPDLVDIRDATPRSALEGERALAVGALAPDTATSLPTVMLVATALLLAGAYLIAPRRRRRHGWAFWRRQDGGRRGAWRLRTAHRRRFGVGVTIAGALLMTLGAREYAEGAQAKRRARNEWFSAAAAPREPNAAETPNENAPGDSPSGSPADARNGWPSGSGVDAEPGDPETRGRTGSAAARSVVPLPVIGKSGREFPRGKPVARLIIPAIDLDEVVIEGVGPVELNGGPGHYPGSVLPGERGNSVMSAHRDRHFSRMDELAIGSRIRTETRSGSVEWVVTDRRIVSRGTPALYEESSATLTLTTCWPLRYFGPAPDRLLLVARPVG